MPVVFGCAPIVNTAFTMYFAGTYKHLEPVRGGLYFAGLMLVILGASLVLMFPPRPPKPAAKESTAAKPAILSASQRGRS